MAKKPSAERPMNSTFVIVTAYAHWHDTHTVRRVEMAYGLEAYAGQQLRVYRHTLSDDRVAFEVRRPTEEEKSESVLVRAVLTVKTRN